jgi:hypothetical protein
MSRALLRDLVRVRAPGILARRRPWAAAVLYAWEALLGLLLGDMFASVASAAFSRHPDGDAPLFAPGGTLLLDLLRHSAAARGPLLGATLMTILAARFLGLVPSAVALAELAFATRRGRAPSFREAMPRALAAMPASFTITTFELIVQGALVGGAVAGAMSLSAWGADHGEEPRGDKLALAAIAATFVLIVLVGVVADVARAVVVRDDAGFQGALGAALRTFASRPLGLTFAYAWRALAALAPVIAGCWVAVHTQAGGVRALVVMGVLHQAIVLGRVGIRLSWMAAALRLGQPVRPRGYFDDRG